MGPGYQLTYIDKKKTMEITVKTVKKYDYKLTINKVDYNNSQDDFGKSPFQVHGRHIRENGEQVYNGTVKYFSTKAKAITFYRKKMLEVSA
jgi:hypothetical protein